MDKVSPIYNNIVQQIKSAILESQLESARAVNQQMLSLYYAIGQFVSANSREGTWGTGAIETISAQLRREMPGLRGFSATSIKKMRQFYEKWEEFLNRPPMAGELEKAEFDIKTPIIPIHALINLNRSPMAEVFKGAQREISDVKLSRYACYLIVMNGDPRKEVIYMPP